MTTPADTPTPDVRAIAAELLEAVESLGLRNLVAGWNGEGREDGPYDPHPSRLGVKLPTTAGRVYRIDKASRALRAHLKETSGE